jgi:phosphoribosylformylglycinamidine cyclo-ligase
MAESMYAQMGVDAGKASVREAFGAVVTNHFPGAFVNIVVDPDDRSQAFTLHADGDGSKFLQRLLQAKLTGDYTIVGGAVDDALSMNTGDIAAAGFVERMVICDVLNMNKFNVSKKEVMLQIARRLRELIELYRSYGIELICTGGETADLPDQTSSTIFDISVFSRARLTDLIIGNTAPGDQIFGFRSDGQAVWETEPNSGIMSNGVTLARKKLMLNEYAVQFSYLSSFDSAYQGRFSISDTPEILGGMTVGDAICSPTRQWAILIRLLIQRLKAKGLLSKLHGICMNTGGGAYKIGHLGKGIRYCKSIPIPSPIFRLIQEETGETWKNMFETMNCGIGLDVVCENDPEIEAIIATVSEETGVVYNTLGDCEASGTEANEVVLHTPYGTF